MNFGSKQFCPVKSKYTCLLVKIVFIRMTTPKKQPRLAHRACFTLSILVSLTLLLSVLQESNEGGNPCTRSNHDDWSAGVVWEVEWIEDSRKNWNLKFNNEKGTLVTSHDIPNVNYLRKP